MADQFAAHGAVLEATYPSSRGVGKVEVLMREDGRTEIRCPASTAVVDTDDLVSILQDLQTQVAEVQAARTQQRLQILRDSQPRRADQRAAS